MFSANWSRYHVPSHLTKHIDYVTPGVGHSSFAKRSFGRRKAFQLDRRAVHNRLSTCGDHITPACLKALYDIPDATLNQPVNELGIYEDHYDVYDQTDLNLFFAAFAPYVPQGTHPKLVSVNGAKAPTTVKNGGGESTVDFDIAFSLLYPQSITLYESRPTIQERLDWRKQVPGSPANKNDYVNSRSLWEVLLDAVDGAFCTKADKAAGAECGTVELTRVSSNVKSQLICCLTLARKSLGIAANWC